MPSKGLVFISKTTFSGASSVNIDNCFSATYKHYLIRRNLSHSVGAVDLQARMRVSSADDTGANYRRQYINAVSTSIGAARETAQTAWNGAFGISESTSIGFAEMWVSNPFDAARTTFWTDFGYTMTGNISLAAEVGAHDLTTSYTGITFYPLSGTITGSISVFGLVTA